jgi:hypothetical protein
MANADSEGGTDGGAGAATTTVRTGAGARRLTSEVRGLSTPTFSLWPPARYRAPTTIAKYDGETNQSIWLEDYRFACHNSSATSDLFIIKSIPLYLAD